LRVRNRVIAALATGTLVIEAAQRSGALNTARHARDLGRSLMAVPGPVTSDLSAGCHQIIRDWQGTLVTSAADVIEQLSPLSELPEPADQVPPVIERDLLDLESKQVLDALPRRGGLGTSQVARRAGVAPNTALRKLGELAAGGFIERCADGWRLRRA
jgi:DNA processing protein